MGGSVFMFFYILFFANINTFSTNLDRKSIEKKKDYSNIFKEKKIDNFLKEDEYEENPYVMKKKYKILAERSLSKAMLFPLYGQIYNWKVLGITDYKKTLYFALAFGVALGFFIYNQARFIDSKYGSSNQNLFYRHRTYSLSFLSIIYGLCVFDAYASVYKYRSDFSSNLSVVEKISPDQIL